MKDRLSQFKCHRCGEERSHYCLGMCNRCYQRHLREKNKDRKIQNQGMYSYKHKKNNYPFSSPKVGEAYQSDLPENTRPSIVSAYTKVHSFPDQDGVERFLKFCKLIFSDYPAEGDIIKGACGIEERALNLLEKYGDVHKAMYAVKNPISVALNPDLVHNLPQEEIEREVNQIWKELIKVKIDNKDEFLEKMKKSVESGINEQELQMLLQIAANMKVKVPKEITNQLTDSENFSKILRKKLVDKSLTIEELKEIKIKISDFNVKTSTMQQLQEVLYKAEDWTSRVKKAVFPTIRYLQNLVSEGSSLPLCLPELNSIKEKYRSAKKWADNVHNLIKSWKCKKDIRTPLSEVQALINESKALQIVHHDVQILEDSVQKVLEWQERIKMTEEDIYCNEYIVQLLEEGQTLPLEVDSLEGMKNTFNWTARAKKIFENKKINQKQLIQITNEGKNKNINNPMLKEMQNLVNSSKQWKEKVKKVLSGSNEGIETLKELIRVGESLNIEDDGYLNQLRSKLNRSLDFQDQSKVIRTASHEKLNVGHMRNIKKQNPQPPVILSDFEDVKHQLRHPENWSTTCQNFIKRFPRTIPSAEEVLILNKLLEDCPSALKATQEHSKLEDFKMSQTQWTLEAEESLRKENLSQINDLVTKSHQHPVDLGIYEKISIQAACIEWKAKVKASFKDHETNILSKLKLDLPSQDLKTTSEYKQLQNYLEKYEKWASELDQICEEGNIESLENIYKSGRDVSIPSDQKNLIKRSLIGIYSWKDRVNYFLNYGGEISEGKALLKEGEYVCFECEEQEKLSALLQEFKIIRKKASKIINNLPSTPLKLPMQSRIYKKRYIYEEYKLESTDDMISDLISSIDNAIEATAPMEPKCYPLYHPTQGLSLIINTSPLFKTIKIPEEKKKRSITYKQLNEDIKNIKRPPRRPKNIEISRQNYCICKNEASWNDTIMINCDYCGEWYHPSCISIDTEDIDKIEEFCCFICYERIGIRYDRNKRQTYNYSDFISLLKSFSNKFTCDEVREIQKIAAKVEDWKVEANEILDNGLMTKEIKKIYESDSSLIEEQQYLFDGKIMKMLVEYEGIPIILEERESLLNLIRKRDWLREAYQSIFKKNSYRNIKKLIKEKFAFDDEEFDQPTLELQKILNVIQDYNSQLQDMLKNTPKLKDLKKFFENEDLVHYKLDLFEKSKKKMEQFQNLLAEIKAEINAKDHRKLPALISKAEKLGIYDELLEEARRL